MAWNFRVRPKLGPFRLNVSKRGLRSVSFTLGPYTRNLRTGRSSIDSPGPGSIQWGGGKRKDHRSGSGLRFVLGFLFCVSILLALTVVVLYQMFLHR